jgi:hypothetical protein
VASIVIFVLQRYGVHLLIQWILFQCKGSDVAEYARLEKSERVNRPYRRDFPNNFFKWRNDFLRQDALQREKSPGYKRYMEGRDLFWGYTHGTLITIIELGVALFFVEGCSVLGSVRYSWMLGLTLLFIVVWFGMMVINIVAGRNIATILHQSIA